MSLLLFHAGPDDGCSAKATKIEDDKRTTYIVETDLVRFAKFAGAVLTVFVIVGAYLYGFKLEQAIETAQKTAKEVGEASEEAKKTQAAALAAKNEATTLLQDARANVLEIQREKETAHGIVSETDAAMSGRTKAIFADLLNTVVIPVLNDSQRAAVTAKLEATTARRTYSEAEVKQLLRDDIRATLKFYRQNGLSPRPIPFKVGAADLMNSYWDGQQVVFGMGLVNSENFGPYDHALVVHEATHSLFNVGYEGQSGALSESICDVIGVLVSGNNWTIGLVRGPNGTQQFLHSLSNPGTAYDNAVLGKDRQVDHMSAYVTTETDNGGIHINSGIPNKAAFLMAEGGTHRGVVIARGIGRQRLGQLYMAAIRKLPNDGRPIEFAGFRELLLATARELAFSDGDLAAIRDSYRAVGL